MRRWVVWVGNGGDMHKVRVAHILYSFDTGGLEKGVATLVRHASSDMEHVIVCLSSKGRFDGLLPAGTRVVALGKSEGNSAAFIWRLARFLKSIAPDVVHTRNWNGIDGIIASRIAGIGAVVHGEHGWGMDDPYGLNPKRVFVRRFLSRYVFEYTCVSKSMERWLKEDIGVRKRVTQIYNGIDTERYRPGNGHSRIRDELGIGTDAPVLGMIGRLDPIKDHTTLLEAFEAVRARFDCAHLLVVGDGPEQKRLKSLGGEGAHFLGNRQDVPEILQALDVFVLPSLNEGVSNTILEAMAAGLPIVATRVGGNSELILHAQTGVLVSPGDSRMMGTEICRYLKDPQLRAMHGKAARERAMHSFSVETMVRAYEEIYRRARHC